MNSVTLLEMKSVAYQGSRKLNKSVNPLVNAPRPVPASIHEQLKLELDNLQRCGITSVIQPTEWVNSIVCVRKTNGCVQICIDPTDLNKAISREHFPKSTINDISTRLNRSKYFSTLDANMGYFQIRVDEKSLYATTLNTPFGMYLYLRMPMGLKCSSEEFFFMENLLNDLF